MPGLLVVKSSPKAAATVAETWVGTNLPSTNLPWAHPSESSLRRKKLFLDPLATRIEVNPNALC
jgi:hypothetical protein